MLPPPPPPDPEEEEPRMLPPYGHDVNPRCCSYPLLMLSACLDRASLTMYTGIERLHGALYGSGGAPGHGTGPWDDITGVVKRGTSSHERGMYAARMQATNMSIICRFRSSVDGWMMRCETEATWMNDEWMIRRCRRLSRARVTQAESDALLVA